MGHHHLTHPVTLLLTSLAHRAAATATSIFGDLRSIPAVQLITIAINAKNPNLTETYLTFWPIPLYWYISNTLTTPPP